MRLLISYFIGIGLFASIAARQKTQLKLLSGYETIVIKGRTDPSATMFSIDLARTSRMIEDDIPLLLHFDLTHGSFFVDCMKIGHASKAKFMKSPVKAGENFQIEITCQDKIFSIKINGMEMLTFESILPVSIAEYATVRGAHADSIDFVNPKPKYLRYSNFRSHRTEKSTFKQNGGYTSVVVKGKADISTKWFVIACLKTLDTTDDEVPLIIRFDLQQGIIDATFLKDDQTLSSESTQSPIRIGENYHIEISFEEKIMKINGKKVMDFDSILHDSLAEYVTILGTTVDIAYCSRYHTTDAAFTSLFSTDPEVISNGIWPKSFRINDTLVIKGKANPPAILDGLLPPSGIALDFRLSDNSGIMSVNLMLFSMKSVVTYHTLINRIYFSRELNFFMERAKTLEFSCPALPYDRRFVATYRRNKDNFEMDINGEKHSFPSVDGSSALFKYGLSRFFTLDSIDIY